MQKYVASFAVVVIAVQSLNHFKFFATLWTAAHQASLSFTVFLSLLKLMSIDSVMPSTIEFSGTPFFCLQSFSALRYSPMSGLLTSGGQSTGASASVLQWIFRVDSLIAQLTICLHCRRPWFDSWVGKICWRRDRLPTPVFLGFPCGSAGKESACNVEDLSSIPGLGRFPGEGKGYPLQYSSWRIPWTV